jgi:hypothetical protein
VVELGTGIAAYAVEERRKHVFFIQKTTAGNLYLVVPAVHHDFSFFGRDDRLCIQYPTGDEPGIQRFRDR